MAKVSAMPAVTAGDVVDADEFYILDGGVSKKISAVNLAQISQITSRYVAQSTLTTDGDVLTRASGSPARITRADLAQDTAFSSRYAPLANDVIVVSGAELIATLDTPAAGTLGNATATLRRTGVMLFDATNAENATWSGIVPSGWTQVEIDLWWSNAGAGAGDVVWNINVDDYADGVSTDATPFSSNNTTIAAPAQYVLKKSTFSFVNAITAGNIVRLTIRRAGNDAADTLGNDAGVLCVVLRKA